MQHAITGWSIEEKIFRGFDPSDYRNTVINLGQSRDMARVASWAMSLIPQDESFLKTKYIFTRRKIKFSDCVLNLATGQARNGFVPEEKFIVHVGRPMPPRVPADIDAARSFVQDIVTLPEQAAPRSDDYNFDTMPLWQFVSLAIGTSIASDVKLKLMYAIIR